MKRCLNCMEEYTEELEQCPYCGFSCEEEKGQWLEPGSILQSRYIVGVRRRQKQSYILYLGWDALFSRKVFIQEYFPQGCAVREEDQGLKTDEPRKELFTTGRELFLDNGLKLIALDETLNLLNVFSVFEENQTAYATMEYPGDRTLLETLQENGPLQEAEALCLIRELSDCLEKVRQQKVFHCQISPDCCFYLKNSGYKLGCFSGADSLCTQQKPDAACDVFGLADLAGMALTGVKEWKSSTAEQRLALLETVCSPAVLKALKQALNETPELRPESAALFISQLFEEEKTVGFPEEGAEPVRKRPWIKIRLKGLVVLGVAAAAGLFLLSDKSKITTPADEEGFHLESSATPQQAKAPETK